MELLRRLNGDRGHAFRISRQILRTMKILTVIMMIALVHASAKGLSQKVTLQQSNAPLKSILRSIGKQTGYNIFYQAEDIDKAHLVNIHVTDVPLKQVLDICFANQSLVYSIEDGSIVIKAQRAIQESSFYAPPPPPLKKITGRVVDENGDPVIASIAVKQSIKYVTTKDGNFSFSGKVTSSNADGYFTLLNVEDTATLVVSGVNIETQEVNLDGRSDIRIVVKTKIGEAAPDVTVSVSNGYQRISKERSTGAYAQPDMKVVTDRVTSMNILQRLDGLVPGLVINNTPGSYKQQYLIRGLTSLPTVGTPLTNASPLFIVDGIAVNDISSINPNDVADVNVLEDATAASIWGARSSNGVIVITTKRGQNNKKLKVNYDAFINFQGKPNIAYFPVLSSAQYIQASKETFDPVSFPHTNVYSPATAAVYTPDRQILYDMYSGKISQAAGNAKLDSLASISNLSQMKSIFYRPAMLMNHTISISGGTEKFSNYTSLAYTNNQDYTPGNQDKTFKVNTRQDYIFNKFIKAFLIADLTNERTSTNRPFSPTDRFVPYQLFRDASGNNISTPYLGILSDSMVNVMQALTGRSLDYNIINNQSTGFTKVNLFTARATAGVTVNLYKGLRYEGIFGYFRNNNKTEMYDDNTNYNQNINILNFAVNNNGTITYNLPNTGGRYATSNFLEEDWTVRNQLVYDNSWNDRLHQLTVLAGEEVQEQRGIATSNVFYGYNLNAQTYSLLNYQTLASTGIANPILQGASGGNTLYNLSLNPPFTKTETQQRFKSYYANLGYTYHTKYTINASWRQDKSNLFGVNKSANRKPIWSLGAKWLIGHEAFLDNNKTINNLALRVTYGITGNSPLPGSSASVDVFTPLANPNVPGGVGYIVATPGNPLLTWEKTKTLNIGIDFSLINYRLSGSVNYYDKRTSDLLGSLTINPLSGFNTIIGNVGNLNNKGFDASISSVNIRSNNFMWNTSLTISYNKNRITKINQTTPIVTGTNMISAQYVADYPAFSLFAYNYAGLNNHGDPLVRNTAGNVSMGMNDSIPLAKDVLFKGVYQPTWTGGLSNSFTYKNFTFAVNIVYNLGGVMFRDANTTYVSYNGTGFTNNLNTEFANRWKQPGDESKTNIPAYETVTANAKRNTDYYVRGSTNVLSSSYMKIRDMGLSYKLPQAIVKKLKAEDLSLRVGMSNIMLWNANKYGIDPEFQNAQLGTRSLPFGQNAFNVALHLSL